MDLFVLASGQKEILGGMALPWILVLFALLSNLYYFKFKPLEERVAKLEELLSKQETTEND